jgi:hypothetical protein
LTGRIVGLIAEHQRPDAANFVIFECQALSGYEHAKTIVSRVTNEPLFAAAQNDEERITVVLAPIFTSRDVYSLANSDS